MDASGRPRNMSNAMGRGPAGDSRRPPGTGGRAPGPPSSASSATAASSMSRAERFDDERRRITESCFSRVDDQGQLVESYITHIRVQEDAASPQSPPPPNGNPANKKARAIIVSVRSTGRVRLHKARENANGTFSIGKTWNMEELSAVENWAHLVPKSEEEAQHKRWAGDVGFTVTISKPYYWEAGTAKEKEFFIGSMVKIYHKYTQGDFPVLTGFTPAELENLTNGRPQLATAEGRAARRNGGTPPPPRAQQSPSQMPQKSPSAPLMQRPTPPIGGPSEDRDRRPPPLRDERRPTPLSGDRQTPPDSRRPPPLSEDRVPPPRNRPPTAEGERRPPPRRPPTAEGERRPPPLRGATPQGRTPEGQSGPGTPNLPGYFGPGDDAQRRPRPRPSIEQSMRSRPSQEQMSLRSAPSREQMGMRAQPSREQMRPMPPPGTMPTPPIQRLTPKSSRSDLALRSATPDSSKAPTSIPTTASPGKRSVPEDVQSVRSQRSRKSIDEGAIDGTGLGISGAEQRRPNGLPQSLRPGTAQSNASSRNDEPPLEHPIPRNGPPERKRPPMLTANSQLSQKSVGSDKFVTPAQSPPPLSTPPILQAGRPPPGAADRPRTSASQRESDTPPLGPPSQPPTSPLPKIPTPVPAESVPPPAAPEERKPSAQSEPELQSPVEETPAGEEEGEQHRPGLGPMVKKKAKTAKTAEAFRKAAFAAGAFKPRAGGAAARLFAKDSKPSDEADGINAVFVPQRMKEQKEEAAKKAEEVPKETERESTEPEQSPKDQPAVEAEPVPSVTVSAPEPALSTSGPADDKVILPPPTPETTVTKSKPEPEIETRKKKRRSNQQIMNVSKLGIDPTVIEDRGLEFENLLSDFSWWGSDLSKKSIETLEHDIKLEIARVEAGSWLNHLGQKDDRVEAVEKMLDRAIAECDELEGLLTLYNVELSSLNDDIAFIEAQSQGLQVQTANQKLLQNELQQLVETISITNDQLEPLRRERIGKIAGLKAIESSLVLLYKALMTIDPAIIEDNRGSVAGVSKASALSGFGNSELANMQALQEKKERYLKESAMFLDRLKQHMAITFGAAFIETKDLLSRIDRSGQPSTRANVDAHDAGRRTLWMFSPLILFAKEIDRTSWAELVTMYQTQAAQVYQEEVRDNVMAWKRQARKPMSEEQELLFTAQEKEPESITGAARKLTVKRSQTLARGLRSASGEKEGKAARAQTGKLHAFDVFGKVLDDAGPLLLTEQNFITDFFHATSTNAVDFPEAVSAAAPEERRSSNLWIRRPFEADRAMAKRVAEVMGDIFSFWPKEVQNLTEWAVSADPLQGVGILCAVERKLIEVEDSNQDFLTKALQKIHERLTGLFTRFVDEQVRAIEDTKVKIKKRKGVIRFMTTFPHFSMAIENMLPAPDEFDYHVTPLECRKMVDDAYHKINKAMFESLKVIAKESPAVMATQGQADPEDKEALNYHILLIENMNHYLEEVDARSDSVLLTWKAKAEAEMREHMALYVDAVIRRPLGKLLEFVESTEALLAQPGASGQAIAQRSSHSRSVFKKLVHANDAKEIRKGIEHLKKRVDKHFGDADEAPISRNLVTKVYGECEARYVDVHERTVRVAQDVYMGEVEVDWGVADVQGAFRR